MTPSHNLTLFLNPKREDNPTAVCPVKATINDELEYPHKVLSGTWWRVMPSTGADHCFLSMLEHHRDKFAPAKGDGVLLSTEVMVKHATRYARA